MLTAKHVSESGHEYVVDVASVEYLTDQKPAAVRLNYAGDAISYIAVSGSVYVMNDLGKTVASYHLSSVVPE